MRHITMRRRDTEKIVRTASINSNEVIRSVHKSRGDRVVCMWVQLKIWCMSCLWVLQRGHSGHGCDLVSTLCKGDLFVLSWARV